MFKNLKNTFRLKLIQIIDFFHNDDFLMRKNVSVSTDDYNKIAGEFPPFLYSVDGKRPFTGRLIMKNLIATWRSVYSTPMALILTRWGWCYSFNIANYTDLVHFKK